MEDNSEETTVRVAVRCRPFNSREKANGETSCVRITSDQIVLVNPSGHSEEHSFAFDTVIDESFSQESVWSTVGMPILNKAFSGFNATIFAYGQTGSGKTWSMQGGEGELQGIIPRMNYSLFERISLETSQRPTVQFLITVSYFEIYNEVIFDLLDSSDRRKRAAANKGGLEIKEHPALGVYVKGLQEIVVDSAPKLQNIIDQGMKSRTVASTQMNADSSRSHSVFLINVHQKDVEDESKNIFAKVNLVDLAGSERVKSTGATGSILKESANINKSLSALGNVINALVEASKGKGAFIPYRNSKLTRVLQESLGGNSITAMLAALSPAACNFEETLSTLKYANRAKSIKVKAVKNEQSNAISRLNDEIKALKDKLATQGGGQSEQGESALEDKNRQRLLDLEEAMKSTWEAKSKMSQEYERDRQQLLIEQQNAARQLDAARQRNWAALQQKGDLDSTLSHVRTLVADRTGGPVAALLSRWTEALREVGVLEKALSEQDTVVQVYRSTLARDSEALVQQSTPHADDPKDAPFGVDSTALMLRQLREKLLMTKREMGKWTGLQEQLQERLLLVVGLVRGASIRSIVSGGDGHPESPSDGLAKGERREMSQGLSLVRSQVQQKLAQCYRGTAAARRDFLDLEGVRGDMVRLLEQCDGSIEADKLMEGAKDGAGAGKNGAGAKDEAAEEMGLRRREAVEASQEKVRGMVVQLAQVFSTMEGEVANSARASASTPVIASTSARESGQQAPTHIPFSEQVVQEHVQLDCDAACIASAKTALCPTSASAAAAGPRLDASLIAIDSASCWACVPGTYSLTLVLPTAQLVTALNLQGGFVFPGDAQTQSQTQEQTQGQAQTQAREVETIRTVKLPSGVSLSTLDPRFEITASALADVLDWSSLLKSNPPEKFLRRPPVRFLFDLVRHIAEHNAGFMGTLGDAQWAEVGTDKASKLDFMDQVVVFVTECVHSPQAVTSAGAIVTGSDPELTNLLLQQLAIALYCFQHNVDTSSVSVSASTSVSALGQAASSASSAPSGRSGPSGPGRATEAWVTSLRVELSPDGLTWVPVPSGELFTGLSAAQQVVTLSLLPAQSKDAATTSPARFVRITPLAWNGGEAFGPALRVALLRPELLSEDEAEEAGDGGGQDSEMTVRTALVVEVVDVLVGALGTLMETVAFRARSEEQRRELKKLEVKKHLETLAREKQVLEQLLASEKQSLESDNQDLSDQLKKCFSQMKETQGLLQKEQEISAELGKSRAQLEGEKSALQRALGEKEETNGRLAAEVLGLQANAEKDRREQQAVGERVQQSEGLAETLQEQLSQAEEARTADEAEREDLLGQIQILIEERDTARAEEEDLFERLGERSNDLDRLQESYVEIADRCNDHQDEAMDLRDRVEALESALSSSMQAALTPVTFATAAPVVAPVAVAPFVSVAVAAAAPARADSPTQATHGTDADATDATACAKDSPRSLSSPAKIAGCGGGVGAKARKDSKQSKPLGAGAIPQAGADSKLASPPRAPADEYAEDFDDDYADEFED